MKKNLLYTLIILVILSSCEKTNTLPDRFTAIPAGNTYVKFMNLSPDAPSVNFFVNDQKITGLATTTTGAITGLAFGSFFPNLVGYSTIPAGNLKIDVKVPDSSTVLPGSILLTTSNTFEARKNYTYAIVDSTTTSPRRLSAIIIEDDLTVPDASRAYFRIINFITNSPVKVEITKMSLDYPMPPKIFSSIPSKTALPFDSLGAGAGQAYKIMLRHPVTDAKLDSVSNFTPGAGRKYTFYTRGVMGQTGSTNTRRPLIFSMTNF